MGEREERSYTDATAGLPVPKVTAEREVQPNLCTTSPSGQCDAIQSPDSLGFRALYSIALSPNSCLDCP